MQQALRVNAAVGNDIRQPRCIRLHVPPEYSIISYHLHYRLLPLKYILRPVVTCTYIFQHYITGAIISSAGIQNRAYFLSEIIFIQHRHCNGRRIGL